MANNNVERMKHVPLRRRRLGGVSVIAAKKQILTYIVPGRRCRINPPTVAKMRPPMHIGENHALARSGLALRTFSMLLQLVKFDHE
jgi:hypothetical protein